MISSLSDFVLTFNGACLDYSLLHDEWRLIGAWSAVGYQRWVFGEEAVNNNSIVFGLIRLGLGSTIYNTWEEHANQYTTATVKFLQDIY